MLAAAVAGAEGAGEGETAAGLPQRYPESRVEVDVRRHPWRAIGKLNTAGGRLRSCTATLVGERVIVTAAHCLWNPTTRRFFPPEYVHFVPGYQRGERPAHSVARRIVIGPGFTYKRGRSLEPADLVSDWALLELQEPLGRRVGYLGWGRLDPAGWQRLGGGGAVFESAGYRGDRPHVQTVDHGCRLEAFTLEGRLVRHRCPTTMGDSGGPLLLRRGDAYFLVGIHVGATRGSEGARGWMVPSASFARPLMQLGVTGSAPKGSRPLFGRPGRAAHSTRP